MLDKIEQMQFDRLYQEKSYNEKEKELFYMRKPDGGLLILDSRLEDENGPMSSRIKQLEDLGIKYYCSNSGDMLALWYDEDYEIKTDPGTNIQFNAKKQEVKTLPVITPVGFISHISTFVHLLISGSTLIITRKTTTSIHCTATLYFDDIKVDNVDFSFYKDRPREGNPFLVHNRYISRLDSKLLVSPKISPKIRCINFTYIGPDIKVENPENWFIDQGIQYLNIGNIEVVGLVSAFAARSSLVAIDCSKWHDLDYKKEFPFNLCDSKLTSFNWYNLKDGSLQEWCTYVKSPFYLKTRVQSNNYCIMVYKGAKPEDIAAQLNAKYIIYKSQDGNDAGEYDYILLWDQANLTLDELKTLRTDLRTDIFDKFMQEFDPEGVDKYALVWGVK